MSEGTKTAISARLREIYADLTGGRRILPEEGVRYLLQNPRVEIPSESEERRGVEGPMADAGPLAG